MSEANEVPQSPQPMRQQIAFPTVEPYVVYVLLASLVVVYLLVLQDQFLYFEYGQITELVVDGEYYRLFTSMFLHQGLLHLGFNCLGLYLYGRQVEMLMGHHRFAAIYIFGGLTGGTFTLATTSNILAYGASGAVFAVVGAMASYIYRNRARYGDRANQILRDLAMFGLLNLVIGFGYNFSVDGGVQIGNAAHIGGAVGGILLAWAITPIYEFRFAIGDDGLPRKYLVDGASTTKQYIYTALYAVIWVIATVIVIGAQS